MVESILVKTLPQISIRKENISKHAISAYFIEYMKTLKKWRLSIRKGERTEKVTMIKQMWNNGNSHLFGITATAIDNFMVALEN